MADAADDDVPMRIVRNRAKCRLCGDIVESVHQHELKICACGAVGVDGGRAYLRRLGRSGDREEFLEFASDTEDQP